MGSILYDDFEFRTEDDLHKWTLYLMSEDDNIPVMGGYMALSADCPVEIEWHDTDLLTPVQGASLTLKLHAMDDMQYFRLHTARDGKIWISVHLDGRPYWLGTLDTELYEEPYATGRDYEVQLTFSDFGMMDRLYFGGEGIMSVREVIEYCIGKAGFDPAIIYDCTLMRSGEEHAVNSTYVSVGNFYDENGSALTLRQVLDETLRPFAFRMMQRAGRIYIYDTDTLATPKTYFDAEQIYWMSDDARLSVSPTYNQITVSHSPFASATIADGEIEHGGFLKGTKDGIIYGDRTNGGMPGFTMYLSKQSDRKLPITFHPGSGAHLFRFDRMISGEDTCGVLYTAKRASDFDIGGSTAEFWASIPKAHSCYNPAGVCISKPIMAVKTSMLIDSQRKGDRLRFTLEALIDPRYNPYEEAGDHNNKAEYDNFQNRANFGYVPVRILLCDIHNDRVLYHYENIEVVKSDSWKYPISPIQDVQGEWVEGEGAWGDCFLSYYDIDNRKQKSGFGLWTTNRQTIGYYRDPLPRVLTVRGDGMFTALPPAAGYIRMEIGTGIYQFDYKREEKTDVYDIIRWVAYRNPRIALVDNYGNEVDDTDIEHTAWLNPDARSDLDVDTILDTASDTVPPSSARGCLLDEACAPIETLERNGNTLPLSHLLISAAYSAYAQPHPVLSGTVRLTPDLAVYTEASMPERQFMATHTIQDLRAYTEQSTYHAISRDIYTPLKDN